MLQVKAVSTDPCALPMSPHTPYHHRAAEFEASAGAAAPTTPTADSPRGQWSDFYMSRFLTRS